MKPYPETTIQSNRNHIYIYFFSIFFLFFFLLFFSLFLLTPCKWSITNHIGESNWNKSKYASTNDRGNCHFLWFEIYVGKKTKIKKNVVKKQKNKNKKFSYSCSSRISGYMDIKVSTDLLCFFVFLLSYKYTHKKIHSVILNFRKPHYNVSMLISFGFFSLTKQ